MRRPDRRAELVRAVDQIVWAWPHAVSDVEARGFRSRADKDPTGHGPGISDPTSAAALNDNDIHDRAERWLDDWATLVRTVARRYQLPAPRWYPPAVQAWMGRLVDHNLIADPPAAGRLYRLADQALDWWPPPPKPSPDRKGWMRRLDDDGLCGLCQLPAPSGRDLETGQRLARTINGVRYHNTARTGQACFWLMWRELQKARVAG